MPVYFVCRSDVSKETVQIAPPLAHHLNVLRYQPGDTLTLVDERGTKYRTQVVSITSKQVRAQIVSESTRPAPPQFSLHLGIACIKGARMDWIIEKGVELGARQISPLITRRVGVKVHPDRIDHQQKRWEAIALEAAQQSERWEIPPIDRPSALKHFLEQTQSYPLKFIFWEHEAHRYSLSFLRRPTEALEGPLPPLAGVAVLIGPEGGWEKEEVAQAQAFGYYSVSLGDRPLRADTAAVAALTLLHYELQND